MKSRLPVLLLVLCGAGFAAGIAWLFVLRFESGDVYPPYSSLRADPLGCMALYESLERMPGLTVRRDFSSANKLPEQDNVAYLHFAGSPYEWNWVPNDLLRDIDNFLTRGGRLVITFFPRGGRPLFDSALYGDDGDDADMPKDDKKSDNKDRPRREKARKKEKMSRKDEESAVKRTSLSKKWGLGFSYKPLEAGEGDKYVPAVATNRTSLRLPATLNWHSSVIFTNLDKSWQTIYARGTNAVVIERHFGHGSVVFSSDSWFISNEAMWKDRHADLLAWLVGASKTIYFDEAHLGVMEDVGVAGLMRRYRLHGFIAGLILLAGLFIWKNSLSFVPPYEYEQQRGIVAGKDAAAGFVNLLRRNVPAGEVLDTCFVEWKKSNPHNNPHTALRVQLVQAILNAEKAKSRRERDPIGTYQQICSILKSSGFRVPGSGLDRTTPLTKQRKETE